MKSINVKASVCLLVINIHLSASVFISGNGAFPLSFNTPVVSKTYNRATGTLYLGLAAPGSGVTTGNYAISSVSRFGLDELPSFKAIATPSTITNTVIGALTLATKQGDTTPLLVGLPGVLTESPQSPMVFALSTDGFQTFVESAPLLDASGASGENGQETNGIAAIAANQEFIFAAVRPNEAESDGIDFGNTNSGIAVVRINYDLAAAHQPVDNLQQTAANNGPPISDDGIKAKKLDMNSPELFINASGTVNNDTAIMYWDDPLQRLYIAVNVTSGGTTGDGARSIVVARVDSAGVMTFSDIAPNTAIAPEINALQNQIVAGITDDNTPVTLSINKLSVMHCSTGPSYLIVNGGNVITEDVGNLIFALPLVDVREADGDIDPNVDDNEAIQGTLADKNSSLNSLFRFTTPATNFLPTPQLVENPLNGGTNKYDLAALVGGAPLPIEASSFVSDMVVVDDTVYVSFDLPQGATDETGIIYSQAQFDENGKIISWSPWSKRAFPINGLPGLTNATRIFFFDVDAVTGNIWAIGGDTQQTVASTGWDLGSSTVSLPTQLNNSFPTGCFSVLDLDAYTRGFFFVDAGIDMGTEFRYALFGGVNQVAFALISQSAALDPVHSSQAVTNDFSEAETFLVTKVNAGASITSLEYSRTTDANSNYFFAGTQNGLFVFANAINGSGFSVTDLKTLDNPPFTTSKWVKAPNIPGASKVVNTSSL